MARRRSAGGPFTLTCLQRFRGQWLSISYVAFGNDAVYPRAIVSGEWGLVREAVVSAPMLVTKGQDGLHAHLERFQKRRKRAFHTKGVRHG